MNKKVNKRLPYNDFKYKRGITKTQQISDVMLNLKPVPNGSKNWKFYAKGMVAYVADHQELLQKNQVNFQQNKNLDAYGSYLSYISRDTAKIEQELMPSEYVWHYTNLKQYKGQDISTFKTTSSRSRLTLTKLDDVRNIHKKSHIWSIVISEKDLDMKDIMFKNQHKIVDRIIRSMFDFPVDATLAFHGNTEHPHIHIMVYQPDIMNDRDVIKKWKVKKDKLQAAKKSYYYFLLNNKNYFEKILDEKSKLRQSYKGEVLQRVFQKDLYDLLQVLAMDKIPLLNHQGEQILNKEGRPLYQMKFQYNRLNQLSKDKVNEIRKKLLNLPTTDKDLMNFQEEYKKFRGVGSKLIEEEFNSLPEKKREALILETNNLFEEADEKINQQILKTAKDFYFQNKVILEVNNQKLKEENRAKEDLERKQKQEKMETDSKKFLSPSVWKLITNKYAPKSKMFFHDIGKSQNANAELVVLKQLIEEIKRKGLNYQK